MIELQNQFPTFAEFVNSNKRGAYNVEGRYEGFMIPEYAVREFMKGKVLLPVVQAEILLDSISEAKYPIACSKLERAISIAKGRNE